MINKNKTALEWTGERYVTQLGGTIALEHLHRYAFASEYVKGKVVLDIASGEGYGSEMLSRSARHVYGVDIDELSVRHAQEKYKANNLEYKLGSCGEIPLPDASVDVIISFETIEHVTEHDRMMSEVKRVLRPDGILVISSPDKLGYSDVPSYVNPFHLKELYREEFRALLEQNFKHVAFLGQKVFYGSALIGLEGQEAVSKTYNFSALPEKIESEVGLPCPVYLVAVCSDVFFKKTEGTLCEQNIHENEEFIHQINIIRELESSLESTKARCRSQENSSAVLPAEETATSELTPYQNLLESGVKGIRNRVQATVISIARLYSAFRDEQISKLMSELRLKEQVIAEQSNAILDAGSIVADKESLIHRLRMEARTPNKYVISIKEEIASLKTSLSWKITNPLRFLDNKYPGVLKSLRRNIFIVRIMLSHRRSEIFDPSWYLLRYPDVKAAGMNPWRHFCTYGIFEGRSPCRDFDSDQYLKLHPDILESGLTPVKHYMIYGWKENYQLEGDEEVKDNISSFRASEENVSALINHYRTQFTNLKKDKNTILLVTHDITRTGAPIIALNLAERLCKSYNVIVLSLGGGTLLKQFEKSCDIFIGPISILDAAEDFFSHFTNKLSSIYKIDCSIVNSIVSTPILKSLFENNIPSIHLIHEFASYTLPRELFQESTRYSSKQVFCSELILQNAIEALPDIQSKKQIVIPQGRCIAPINYKSKNNVERERERIDSILSPRGGDGKTITVVMLGWVQMRKGPDIFIECAHMIKMKKPALSIRFVWFGEGFTPENGSLFLKDQIKRSELDSDCFFIEETTEVDYVYKKADILFLSSRLDPLPLVAQEMMSYGKPVVCFDKTTGIAEYLKEDIDASYGVVPYLNVDKASDVIIQLSEDQNLRNRVGFAQKRLSDRVFNIDNYFSKISSLIDGEIWDKKREQDDISEILSAHCLDSRFFTSSMENISEQESVKCYYNSWKTKCIPRKPFPGFHPGIYAESTNLDGGDPLVDYLRKGQPQGVWIQEVLNPSQQAEKIESPSRVALHLHIYYADMADELFHRVKQSRRCPDLLISVPDSPSKDLITNMLRNYSLEACRIAIVPNRGRDIGPLLTEFGSEIITNYEIIGHIHTKKSIDINDREFSKKWCYFLYENLLGGKHLMMDVILNKMTSDSVLGLVYPDDPHVLGWDLNRQYADEIARKIGMNSEMLPEEFNFPVGTMFWARTKALKPLFDLKLNWNDYPEEPLPYDGSVLHAIERLLPFVSSHAGYKSAVTYIPGVTR